MNFIAKIISGGGINIPFSGMVPNNGSTVMVRWSEKYGDGRILMTGEFTIGTQRGGSYGFQSGEPIRQSAFPLDVFRPNERTLEIKMIEQNGVGGMMGVPVKPSRSDDISPPQRGEKLAIYPSPYYGEWRVPMIEVISIYDPVAAANSIQDA